MSELAAQHTPHDMGCRFPRWRGVICEASADRSFLSLLIRTAPTAKARSSACPSPQTPIRPWSRSSARSGEQFARANRRAALRRAAGPRARRGALRRAARPRAPASGPSARSAMRLSRTLRRAADTRAAARGSPAHSPERLACAIQRAACQRAASATRPPRAATTGGGPVQGCPRVGRTRRIAIAERQARHVSRATWQSTAGTGRPYVVGRARREAIAAAAAAAPPALPAAAAVAPSTPQLCPPPPPTGRASTCTVPVYARPAGRDSAAAGKL